MSFVSKIRTATLSELKALESNLKEGLDILKDSPTLPVELTRDDLVWTINAISMKRSKAAQAVAMLTLAVDGKLPDVLLAQFKKRPEEDYVYDKFYYERKLHNYQDQLDELDGLYERFNDMLNKLMISQDSHDKNRRSLEERLIHLDSELGRREEGEVRRKEAVG